jgi:hypothetical protein
MAKRRRNRKRKSPRAPLPHKFSVGDPVRVRPGTRDPDFPNLSLDGWTGDVLESTLEDDEVLYHIQWDQHTLAAMSATARDEARQRGLALDSMWLGEEDVEAPAAGVEKRPTRPEPPNSVEDRIRRVFGLTRDEPLPDADREHLTTYHSYLGEKLVFPFVAHHEIWDELSNQQISRRVRVDGLRPGEADAEVGLLCDAVADGEPVVLPLASLKVQNHGPVGELVADYNYWQFKGKADVIVRRNEAFTDPSAMVMFGLLLLGFGGVCGALVGSVAASSAPAATVIESAAVLGGLLGAVVAFYFLGTSNRYHYDAQMRVALGLVLGSPIGGLLGVLLMALAGALLGGLLGGLLGLGIARTMGPRTATLWGAGAGVLLGIVTQAVWQNAAAWTGLWLGGLIGAVVVPVVCLSGTYISMTLEKK